MNFFKKLISKGNQEDSPNKFKEPNQQKQTSPVKDDKTGANAYGTENIESAVKQDLQPVESYDKSLEKYRRVYSLDNHRLCFLTFYLSKERELISVSFDVEAANDYHYDFKADQLPKICEALFCNDTESTIAAAFAKEIKTWSSPNNIASFLNNAGIKYQSFHY